MKKTIDVLGYGILAVDEILFVSEYPPPDVKLRVSRRDRQCGGLTGTALIAAARLGSVCAYAGMLGDNELSRFVLERMNADGVDTSHVVEVADAQPVHATVIVDETNKTRTILYHVGGPSGAADEPPDEDLIRSARVVLADQYGITGMIRVAKVANAAGVPIVGDLEHTADSPEFSKLLELVDHPILPMNFARELTGASDPGTVVKALWHDGVDTAAVTCGIDGAFYISKDAPGEVRHQEAFIVDTVDTTGCGDVFHGAYASALARGLEVAQRMRLASATAAIKSTKPGGQKGIPTLDEVTRFLETYDR